MVREWRRQWAGAGNAGNGNADWPFGFVELAGCVADVHGRGRTRAKDLIFRRCLGLPRYHRAEGGGPQVVAQLRRQQQLAAALDGNRTFFAVAMDLSDPAVVADLGTGPGGEVHSRCVPVLKLPLIQRALQP